MRQQEYREKNSLQTIFHASLIRSRDLCSLSQITTPPLLENDYLEKENNCPFFFSK